MTTRKTADEKPVTRATKVVNPQAAVKCGLWSLTVMASKVGMASIRLVKSSHART